MNKIIRVIQTLRYLKLTQIYYQIFYRIFNKKIKCKIIEKLSCSPINFIPCYFSSISTHDGVNFKFLGTQGSTNNGWNSDKYSKLWLYKLHYLDDLNAIESDANQQLMSNLVNNWILSNNNFQGNAWEPYPLSMRIVNLIKWFSRQGSINEDWLKSLAAQTFVLNKKIEYHICANHLFANGKALVFSGSFLVCREANKWRAKGLQILDREIDEQFLNDGAHFELSPMYHSIILWDMCDLVNLAMHSNFTELKERTGKWKAIICHGLSWLTSMLHPDNQISFFNDAAFGIAPDINSLKKYAISIGCNFNTSNQELSVLSGTHHSESGYASIILEKNSKLLIDIGSIGPDYQPGHAHADSLSFELSIFNQRVFVNSGTSQYGNDKERNRQRGTAAHNTVEIDSQNSSDVWAGFRVGKRAKTFVKKVNFDKDHICIQAYHNGYRKLFRSNIHYREWLIANNKIEILDSIDSSENNIAIARLHVHPTVTFFWENGVLVAHIETGKIFVKFDGANSVELSSSSWHPEFGKTIMNQCISVKFSSGKLITNIQWSNLL